MIKVALVQLNCGPDIEENLATTTEMISEAAANGAQLVATPENTCHMRHSQDDKLLSSFASDDHPLIPHFANLAKELGIWLLIGSMAIRIADDKMENRSHLFNPEGELVDTYNKIHLFDVDLDTGESHRESNAVKAGERAVTVDVPWGKIGMSICYDLRFAYLYRALAQAGASILTVPAAFTVPTGQAHWETLLRARAIETGSFVLAPAQCGEHEGGRKTYGHSMVIDPWGKVLAEAGEGPEIIYANLDLGAVDKARSAIPALRHDREFAA
jgi:predicted amidohydrolase